MYMYNYVIKSELRIKYPYVLFCVGFDTLHYEFGSNVSTCEYYEGGYVQGDIYLFISLYLSISPSLYTYLSVSHSLSFICSTLFFIPHYSVILYIIPKENTPPTCTCTCTYQFNLK